MKDKKISNCKIYCHPSTILIIEFVQVTQGKLLHISKYLLYFHGMTGIISYTTKETLRYFKLVIIFPHFSTVEVKKVTDKITDKG